MNIFKGFKLTAVFTASIILATFATNSFANHPVLVEGNCNVPPAGTNSVIEAGTCGDYDGDGLIGIDEDNDGDRVFGTINGANSSAGINNNGTILIVTSGTFAEQVTLSGNVTLEAAPGVVANIDAVLQGDGGSGARQGTPGIIIDAPENRRVTVRNLLVKNWTNGIDVRGDSHVLIDSCRVENNVNYGILASDSSSVQIVDTTVSATGYRLNPGTGDFPTVETPEPGIGISFEAGTAGAVSNTTVNGSFGAGISNNAGGNAVQVRSLSLFDNDRNQDGPLKPLQPPF